MWFNRVPEDTRQTTGLSSSHVQQSETFTAMTGACGPYNLGGSTIDPILKGGTIET
jgi:hypothetical protein